jgi:hypothetical protein
MLLYLRRGEEIPADMAMIQGTRCCLSLSPVCCLLSAVCCLLSAVCCLLSAVCCLLSVLHDNRYSPPGSEETCAVTTGSLDGEAVPKMRFPVEVSTKPSTQKRKTTNREKTAYSRQQTAVDGRKQMHLACY